MSPGRRGRFRAEFGRTFEAHYDRILRFLDRIGGDPELAADLAQETFVRLYRRGSLPDSPGSWLISVALNLFRNAYGARTRRRRLLDGRDAGAWHGDPPPPPDRDADAECTRLRVRSALDRLTERERSLLLLRAEGYSYRDLGEALDLEETSVGTLLARARRRFRASYGETTHDG